jgi:hypothetical protein
MNSTFWYRYTVFRFQSRLQPRSVFKSAAKLNPHILQGPSCEGAWGKGKEDEQGQYSRYGLVKADTTIAPCSEQALTQEGE